MCVTLVESVVEVEWVADIEADTDDDTDVDTDTDADADLESVPLTVWVAESVTDRVCEWL